MLSQISWPDVVGGSISTMGILGVVLGTWRYIVRANGRAEKPLGPPPIFPCPKHREQLRTHDHEIAELKHTDERQWNAITKQGLAQAEMKGTVDGIAGNVNRLVQKLLCLLVLLLLPGCALFEGRRQAADCVTRHAARIRVGLAELAPIVPERVRPAVFKLERQTLDIEKWGRAMGEDFKPPSARLELSSPAEDLGRTRYVVAARTKNAIVEAIPKLPEPGNLLGLLAGGGAGLTGIAGIAAAYVRRKVKALAADRDRQRRTADDLDRAVDQIKARAKNGGLDADGFAEVMVKRPLARRHHAERKVRDIQPV